MKKINKMNINWKISLLTALAIIGFMFAGPGSGSLETELMKVCNDIMDLIPPIAFVLVAAAAVSYAFGGVMSSQMRARTHVWAQSLIVGAIVGAIIYVILPPILGALITAGLTSTQVEEICTGFDGIDATIRDGTCAQTIENSVCSGG